MRGAVDVLILYSDTRGLDEGRALCRGRSRAPGSAFAYSLLFRALEMWQGARELPEAAIDARGKPFFPERPDWHFSLSHTRGFVLAAVSASPVGADVQLRDVRGERLADRLMSEKEREDFDFYELWSLRESLYKLTGEGSPCPSASSAWRAKKSALEKPRGVGYNYNPRRCGEIGRRTALKMRRSDPCRFESGHRHHEGLTKKMSTLFS